MNGSNSQSFFSGINRILLVILFILIIFILGQIIYYNFFKKKPAVQTSQTLTNQNNSASTKPTPINIFEQVSPEKPLNELNYEQVKKQVQPGTVLESRFEGVLLNVKKNINGVEFKLESTLPNSRGKSVWYNYNTTTLSKISYSDTLGNKLLLDDLKQGDGLTIDEANDYSKDYPESILTVKITKT